MRSHTIRSHGIYIALAFLLALMLSGGALFAAETDGDARVVAGVERTVEGVRHLRTTDSRLQALIVEGGRRSPLFRKLLDRLDRSTVIAYVESRLLSANLFGRLTFVGGGPRWRYLRIEIECRQSTVNQIAALGHELQHAVEIAEVAAAVDQTSIRALYGTIGFATDDSERRFESDAAQDAGNRVRRELSGHITTTSYAVK